MATALTVGVIGPCGFTGSYVCHELLRRGHRVVGISRRPEQLGTHRNYIPRPADVENWDISALADAFKGTGVLISCYGAHTGGADALQYKPFVETVRRVIIAVKAAKVPYFIFVGGAGSLHVPGTVGVCTVDHPDFFVAYRRAIADSHAHTSYMEERLGHMGDALRKFRNARLAERNGTATDESRQFIKTYEEQARSRDNAADYIRAGRASFMFFDGNTSFAWTFVSPPPLYRAGKRAGNYEIAIDDVPLRGAQKTDNIFEGRLTGITSADLAVAIVDEAETKAHSGLHWTASGDLSDDTPAPSYQKIGAIF